MSSDAGFLYPFLERSEDDCAALLADLATSAATKGAVSAALATATLERLDQELVETAVTTARRLGAGGRLFTLGNGGSSTDAAGVADLFARPPWGRPLPARCLVDDSAVLTALANDVGYELVFSRQIIAYASPGDVVLGLSTSGSSRNLLAAFAEARRRGIATIGLAGYDGGEMALAPDIEHCLVVGSDSVHRIQETQAVLTFMLWTLVQEQLGERGAGA